MPAWPKFPSTVLPAISRAGLFNLGLLYENGRGVGRDFGKAREWYQKAADAGHTDAKQAISRFN
jgi:TPR repeat protein